MPVCKPLLLLVLLFFLSPAWATLPDDRRVDSGLAVWLEPGAEVPVMVRLEGSNAEIRSTWDQLRRSLDGRLGSIESPPDANREFLARVNALGLRLLLRFDQVAAIRRPFEMTFPGE